MKCQNCDGNGRFEVEDNGVVMQGVYWRCPTCGGNGVVEPLTNEEWIKSRTTEQLAEILVCMAEDKSEAKTVHKENVGKCVWWLKQPHK